MLEQPTSRNSLLLQLCANPGSCYMTSAMDAHQSWKLLHNCYDRSLLISEETDVLHNCYDRSLLISEAVTTDATSPVVIRLLQHLLIRMLAHDVDEGEFKILY
jgi:hypothetical protein